MILRQIIFVAVLACLLVGKAHAQANSTRNFSPEILNAIRNYKGCKIWDQNVCLECAHRYYFNEDQICTQVDPQCRMFNLDMKMCQNCYEGYVFVDGSCLLRNDSAPENAGCRTWANNTCVQCSFRFYFNQENVCTQVNDLCRTWSQENGDCLSCYGGYKLDVGSCLPTNVGGNASQNALCAAFQEGACVQCAFRAYFDGNGICLQVSPQCRTFDNLDGMCLSCYDGYDLENGECVIGQGGNGTGGVSDPGCRRFENGSCAECSFRWYFDANGVCQAVNDLCETWSDENGDCLSCYKGYSLNGGVCEANGTVESAGGLDPGCRRFQNNSCAECSFRWYFDANGVCQAVNDLCQTWSDQNGDCLSCYRGYSLNAGACEANASSAGGNGTGANDLCAQFDENGVCVKCAFRAYFDDNGICLEVDPQCKTFPDDAGFCLSCYDGYDLKDGECLYSPSNTQAPASIGCASFDPQAQECLNCSQGWQNADGKCVATSDFCAESSGNETCSKCLQGYELKDGMCMWAPVGSFDPGCRKFENNTCAECSFRFVFDAEKKCMQVNDLCRTWSNETGQCLSCYGGYTLDAGNCFVDNNTFDPGCHQWDWDNFTCEECSFRFVMKEGRCTQVSDLCAAWDETGQCTDCYGGYILQEGECVLGNPLCRQQKKTGGCESCFGGYILDGGQCLSLAELSELGF